MGILENKIVGPYFFPEHVHINADIYAAFLDETLSELLENIPLALLINMIFQQDGHPAHTSIAARTVLDRKFPNRWIGINSNLHEWPPRSPDLMPLDFFAWGYIKDQVYQTLSNSRRDLMNRIQNAAANISPDMLCRVRESFLRRIVLCAEQGGGYFEHLL